MTDRVDVLVIGAGAAGAAFAWRLSQAGIGVLCLEQGEWVDRRAYPADLEDWEIHRQTDWNPDPNGGRLPVDYPVNDAESPIAPLMYNAVGGSTIHWSAHFPRFRPSDFAVRSLDGVASGLLRPVAGARVQRLLQPPRGVFLDAAAVDEKGQRRAHRGIGQERVRGARV